MRFIILFLFARKLIIMSLFAAEIIEKINSGAAIPIPKMIKLNRLAIKLMVDVLIAKSITKEAGLQGSTIAPKKNPKINELKKGFLVTGAWIFGKSFPKSTLNINKILINARIPNAIGEIIPIAFVKDSCKSFVKIKPNKNIEEIIPNVTISPNPIIVFLDSLPDNWPARYAKYPGYNGRTQTAAIGANNPATKEIQILVNAPTI